MKNSDTTLLCFDYGRVHVGVAVSAGVLADALETVKLEDFFSWAEQIIKDKGVQALVVGVSENIMAKESVAFAKDLKKHFKLPVYLHDETLSSYETRKKLAQSGMRKSKREKKIDHYVAASILQDFLDSYENLDQVLGNMRV